MNRRHHTHPTLTVLDRLAYWFYWLSGRFGEGFGDYDWRGDWRHYLGSRDRGRGAWRSFWRE